MQMQVKWQGYVAVNTATFTADCHGVYVVFDNRSVLVVEEGNLDKGIAYHKGELPKVYTKKAYPNANVTWIIESDDRTRKGIQKYLLMHYALGIWPWLENVDAIRVNVPDLD